MRKRSVLAGVGAVGATLVLLVTGCSSAATDAEQETGAHEHESTSQAAGAHNDADATFARDMIPHHEGAVTMAQTEIDNGQSEAAVHLAHEIIETQQREIVVMKQILGSL